MLMRFISKPRFNNLDAFVTLPIWAGLVTNHLAIGLCFLAVMSIASGYLERKFA